MGQGTLSDLVLKGVSRASGGHYRQVRMDGVSKIHGELICGNLYMDGTGTVQGGIQSAEAVEINGMLKVEGGVEATRIDVEGKATFAGRMRAETIRLAGFLRVRGDCGAEQISIEGSFAVEGLLTADRLDIRLIGRGEAREIGGGRIEVTPSPHSVWSKLFSRVIPRLETRLIAPLIEGDEVNLQAVTADTVRGKHVTIGPGCRIGLVEYETELKIHPDAQVESQRRK